MGVLKAVGFTDGRVLNTLLIENALLGFLAGVSAWRVSASLCTGLTAKSRKPS